MLLVNVLVSCVSHLEGETVVHLEGETVVIYEAGGVSCLFLEGEGVREEGLVIRTTGLGAPAQGVQSRTFAFSNRQRNELSL